MNDFVKPLSPDQVNYFHYVGKSYPDSNIVASDERLFLSVFDHNKIYVILKVVDTESVAEIEDVALNLYRRNCALFLGFDFFGGEQQHLFGSTLPIHAKKGRFPTYPEEDEILTVDVHFVCALTGVLIKVCEIVPNDVQFMHGFVAEYDQLRQLDYQEVHYFNAVEAFYAQTHNTRLKDRVHLTSCSLQKHLPQVEEPALTGVQSRHDRMVEESLREESLREESGV